MTQINFGKYLTPKAIVNLSILFGFLIFIAIMLSSLSQEIEYKAETIRDQKAQIESRIRSISKLAELSDAAKEAGPALEEINSLLPSRDELVSFPRYISNMGTESNVTAAFNFRGEEVPSTETEAGYSGFYLIITGTFPNVVDFLENLEKGRFIVKVDSFDVILQRESSDFQADIIGSTFFRD